MKANVVTHLVGNARARMFAPATLDTSLANPLWSSELKPVVAGTAWPEDWSFHAALRVSTIAGEFRDRVGRLSTFAGVQPSDVGVHDCARPVRKGKDHVPGGALMPNPAFERTRSRRPGLASISFWPKPGLPSRPA